MSQPESDQVRRTHSDARFAQVVIVDDHELVRAGLRRVLEGARGLRVVGEAASGRDAISVCLRLQPDVALVDLGLGDDMDGLAVTEAIRKVLPGTRVLLMSLSDAPQYRIEALKAGAAGYLQKGSSRRELLLAIRRACRDPKESVTDLGTRAKDPR